MSRTALAFMSYVNLDDQHEQGRLTRFRECLSGEVRMQTGESFDIFQDRKDIAWGQQWQERINQSLDAVTFLIPIITPGFFKSKACREELERFLKREEELGRGDLILPVYYVNCPVLRDKAKREHDPLAQVIAARQYADWRDLRFEEFTSPQLRKTLAEMAEQIVEALERSEAEASRLQPAKDRSTPASSNIFANTGDQSIAQGSNAIGTQINNYGPQVPIEVVLQLLKDNQPKPAPPAKTEPLTVVVDQLQHGDYTTITEALKAVKAGGKILVRPGLYQEGIIIDKPVEIIGDGERDDIVLEASDKPALLFQADNGRVANLTLRQAGGGDYFGVDIIQGRLWLEDCDISSQSLSCVAIHDGAVPRLRHNRIHDGKESGILVDENGEGTIEDNEIFANALSGVEIRTGGNPTLSRNHIYYGKGCGILVDENGEGTIEDNEIFSNALSGVEIREGGNPTLSRNCIHDGKGCGILVCENGEGTIEDNEIFANALSGVEIRTGGNPTLCRNRICDGKGCGILVDQNGKGTLEENDIFANAYPGVAIRDGGNPILRRNRIYEGKSAGVFVYENGQGTLEDNEIFSNALSGVEIRTGGNPALCRNRIHDGKENGILVHENGEGKIEDNEIFSNALSGVEIRGSGNPTLHRNRITQNSRAGIQARVLYAGGGIFEDNDLRGNACGAWDIAIPPGCAANVVQRRGNKE